MGSSTDSRILSSEDSPILAAAPAVNLVLSAYRNEGWEFVKRALEDKDYVAELSGLAEVQRKAEALAGEIDWEEDGTTHGDDDEGVLL